MYDRTRFFTVTGHRLHDTPGTITDGQDAIAELYRRTFGPTDPADVFPAMDHLGQGVGVDLSDQELLERAMTAGNGDKFARLWVGDTRGYASDSEADLALCSLLAFWAGPDEERIDRPFRQSALCREKWIRQADYRESTIRRALKRGEFWRGGRAKVYALKREAISIG